MNAITKALDELKFTIPAEVLNLAFTTDDTFRVQLTSIDERMLSSVLRTRVFVDANLVGGIRLDIPITSCILRKVNEFEAVITVPDKLLGGRPLINALSIITMPTMGHANFGYGGAATNMMNGVATHDILQSARLEVISNNTILINDPNIQFGISGTIQVTVSNDPNMSNLAPSTYILFSEMCILGVKAYIYNKMVVALGKGYIHGGHELGVIKDIIDGYADANEMYREFVRTKWRKTALMNDNTAASSYITSMFGH